MGTLELVKSILNGEEIEKSNPNHGWHGRFAEGKVINSYVNSFGHYVYNLDNGKRIVNLK